MFLLSNINDTSRDYANWERTVVSASASHRTAVSGIQSTVGNLYATGYMEDFFVKYCTYNNLYTLKF